MNTQESIEFLDKKGILDEVLKMKIKNVKKLAKMLKQGEVLKAENKKLKAYKLVWGLLKSTPLIDDRIVGLMNKHEQKYFPKFKVERIEDKLTKNEIKYMTGIVKNKKGGK